MRLPLHFILVLLKDQRLVVDASSSCSSSSSALLSAAETPRDILGSMVAGNHFGLPGG